MQERGTSGGSQDEGILIGPGPPPGKAAQPEEQLGFQTPPPPLPSPPRACRRLRAAFPKQRSPPPQSGRGVASLRATRPCDLSPTIASSPRRPRAARGGGRVFEDLGVRSTKTVQRSREARVRLPEFKSWLSHFLADLAQVA